MFEVIIEIRVKQSTTQETIDKILASSPPNPVYGKVAIEGTLTLAAESQVIQLAGIPTQEAFGNIDVTVGSGKADGLVRFFISVVTESRTFVRDVLAAVTAGGD